MTSSNPPTLAAILIRGPVHINPSVKKTLWNLRLRNKNTCIIVPSIPTLTGMLRHCRNYITWGEAMPETITQLSKARKARGGGIISFALHPPRGGFERKGIKVPFSLGGALGYRGEAINSLIKKML